MILTAHQPNFIPWLPLLDKINKADVFVNLTHVQFEKNGWQNRCGVNGKYWTKPVCSGTQLIKDKIYTDGHHVGKLNTDWLLVLCETLSIDTSKFADDFDTFKKGTERIIELCQVNNCNKYLTNAEALNKYLDAELMREYGIEILYHEFPYKIHTFEAIERWGITGTTKLLAKEREIWRASLNFSLV